MALLEPDVEAPWRRDVALIPEEPQLLGPQANELDETRRNLVLKELGSARVVGTTKHVEYGTYEGEPASLALLQFNFRGPRTSFRWTNAEVIIKFANQKSDTVPPPSTKPKDASVLMYGPRQIFGASTSENRHWTYEAKAKAGANAGSANIGGEGKVGLETQFDRNHRMAIIGMPSSPSKSGGFKEVGWTLDENDKQKSAIPNQLIVALIVQYDCPFQATITVKVTNNMGLKVIGLPWSKKDDPLLFDPKISPGFKAKTTGKFENLTDDEWGVLLGLRGEWEDQIMSH
ncbi:hypothetical protein BJ875DRAFT_488003 [Amylocarpus encephaloides]|uniref:Uncharacterized protein n=1 Tax=Amylocarpus encephaloides TaxID=45428 RepID=A0A9P8C1K3_9HELO|nr:hypothetical protein BJ875DRAFT_488003 [Amylocarpus encephaloides]